MDAGAAREGAQDPEAGPEAGPRPEAVAGAESAPSVSDAIKARLDQLRDVVLDGLEAEEAGKLEQEQRKLAALYDKLDGLTDGVRKDEEVRRHATELLAETQGLVDDLAQQPETKELMEKARRLWSERVGDEAAASRLYAKLQEKLGQNKDAVQELVRRAPGLLSKLNENMEHVTGQEDMTLKELVDKMNAKGNGLVAVKGDVVAGAEDAKLEELLAAQLGPLIKEKAGALSEALKAMRKEKQGQDFISKGLKIVDASKLGELDPGMDADQVIEWGERIIRDAEARSEVIDKVKDTVLDFLISYLPNVSIPPIEGDREGMLYTIENLDMSGFKIHKEDVDVQLNGFEQIEQGGPFFVVSVTNVSAVLHDIMWSFKQSYFPHLAGRGSADARMRQGSVRIGLQLIKRALDGESGGWAPQLLLAGCDVAVDTIEVNVKDSQLAWLYNTMSELFSQSLRTYIVSLLQDTLMEHMSSLGDTLNGFVSANWPMVASFLDIDVEQLPEREVAEQYLYEQRMERATPSGRKGVYSVTFAQAGQLGIMFEQQLQYVVVKGFRRTPDNQMLPGERGGEVRVGDILIAFNGQQITSLPLPRVIERLRKASRPLHLTFMAPDTSQLAAKQPQAASSAFDVDFEEQRLYLVMVSRWESDLDRSDPHGFAGLVKGFRQKDDGSAGPAELDGRVKPGMALVAVNGVSAQGLSFNQLFQMIRAQGRPLRLRFSVDPEYEIVFADDHPRDLRCSAFPGGHVVVTSFVHRKGAAEEQCAHALQQGDYVASINGESVLDVPFQELVPRLKDAPRPVTVGFRRPGADKDHCEAVFQDGPLGIIFFRTPELRVAFKAFSALPGPAQATGRVAVGHVVLEVNGAEPPADIDSLHDLLSTGALPLRLRLRNMALQEAALESSSTSSSSRA